MHFLVVQQSGESLDAIGIHVQPDRRMWLAISLSIKIQFEGNNTQLLCLPVLPALFVAATAVSSVLVRLSLLHGRDLIFASIFELT